MASRKPPSFVNLGASRTLGGAPLPERAPVPADGRRKVALLVCHGMGQQVPFETIDTAARVMRRANLRLGARGTAPDVTTRIVDIGIGKPVGRAELVLDDPDHGDTDLHIYEAYWAPLTAGKVKLRHVVGFLLGAGVSGLRASRQTFLRWMFGGWQEFARSYKAFWELVIALAFVLALILMNAAIAAVIASRGIGYDPAKWPSPALLNSLTNSFALVLLFWALAAVALASAYWFHEHIDEDRIGWDRGLIRIRAGIWLTKVLVWLALLATIIVGVVIACDLYLSSTGASPTTLWDRACSTFSMAPCPWTNISNWAVAAIWGLLLVASYFIRKFMIEYFGDVVAYVTSHEVSEFYDVREAIRRVAHDLGAAIYALREPGNVERPLYSRVAIAGHSLGSVIAYDTLDRLLLEDSWRPQPDVLRRTSALVTFGSPLDKTAFIFRSQKPVEAEVREALAAGMQPLIAEAIYRQPIEWFNLWSAQDWISGHLTYYDESPPVAAWAVRNAEDDYAEIPLLAHVMYWRSPQLAAMLLAAVRA
jgi:hypothetical protein